ncbi:hypothetical protein [Alkalicoccus urumqiensis]|uniref:Uncharacterized protein n=1 Tax=Alkalicoccus urumqiensis TaxID=1548213 RepID=A0A2P6MM05_ALKUR|nr:hypothetical protein [Alkalicoccus urumqiensis]PRO67270.1 hypothetical protein C6I21_01545 [Alkalicoccus urumqiensis]
MRIKVDYKASKGIDGQVTEEKVPGVIVFEVPDEKFEDRSYIAEKLREETEKEDAEIVSYEQK